MQHRSKHLPIYSLLIGLLLLSVGTNIIFYNRILILQDFVVGVNPWINVNQFELLQKEIYRLENEKYQMVPLNQTTK
jgi:hypothetical protein